MIFDMSEKIDTALSICEKLNDMSDCLISGSAAHISATPTYLSVHWGNFLLWDSEGDYLSDMGFCDQKIEKLYDLTIDNCLEVLNHQVVELSEAFGDIAKMKEVITSLEQE